MAETCPRRGFSDVRISIWRDGGSVVGGEAAVNGARRERWSSEKTSPGIKGTGKVFGESLKSLYPSCQNSVAKSICGIVHCCDRKLTRPKVGSDYIAHRIPIRYRLSDIVADYKGPKDA